MKKLAISSIIKTKFRIIETDAKKVLQHFDETDIHIFRTEIKELKYLLMLAGTKSKKNRVYKLPAALHKFYTAVGYIRSLQLQQHRIESGMKNGGGSNQTAYSTFLQNRINERIRLSGHLLSGKKSFTKIWHRFLNKIPGKIKASSLTKFLLSEIDELNKLVIPYYTSDTSLHAARKVLVSVMYNWNYMTDESTGTSSPAILSGKARIGSIIDLLGDFQDTCISLKLLDTDTCKLDITDEENSALIHMRKNWLKAKRKDRKILHRILKATVPLLSNAA